MRIGSDSASALSIRAGRYAVLVVLLAAAPAGSDAHSLFNSAEEFMGGFRVQIATLPEFPQIGEESSILIRVTDADFIEVDQFTMGMRITFHGDQIRTVVPQHVEGSHWETKFIFENTGNHLVYVDLYDMNKPGEVLTYTFNVGTQSPFGYIFIAAITVGAMIFAIIMGYIYLPRVLGFRRGS